jgi:hypothetical protein
MLWTKAEKPMLVFIHINKTAGRTVRYILRSSFGPGHCEAEPWHAEWTGAPFSTDDLLRLRKLYPRLKSIAGHRITGYVDLQESGTQFRYFTFMRDPLKTCASRFQYNVQYRKKKNLVFEEWIQREWTRNHQTKMIAGRADLTEAIRILRAKQVFVGLTERFDESLLLLKAMVANDLDISYKPVNVSRKSTLAESLLSNASTRQMLVEANQVDQELYDFVQKELYPSFQREYGPSLEADVRDYQQTRRNAFDRWNLTLSRLKQFAIYKPLLALNRRGLAIV